MSDATLAQVKQLKLGLFLEPSETSTTLSTSIQNATRIAALEVRERLASRYSVSPIVIDIDCRNLKTTIDAAVRFALDPQAIGIVGPTCSEAAFALVQPDVMPNDMAMISPSATSIALSAANTSKPFFRTTPSDAVQALVLAEILHEKGISNIAVTHSKDEYGRGLAAEFTKAVERLGGKIAISVAHEDGAGDYSVEIGALAAAGAEHLVVIGYADLGGGAMVQTALDTGAFEKFVFSDGMVSDTLLKAVAGNLEETIAVTVGSGSPGALKFEQISARSFLELNGRFAAQAYDAAAILILASVAADSLSPSSVRSKILEIANAPGQKIFPGELAKAIDIISAGGAIDYEGASDVEFGKPEKARGLFKELIVKNNEFVPIKIR